jgi:hypothetical protein
MMSEQCSDIHRRKRRRRRPDRPAISAGLLLDEQLKGDIGVLSEDLWVELFPKQRGQDGEYQLFVSSHAMVLMLRYICHGCSRRRHWRKSRRCRTRCSSCCYIALDTSFVELHRGRVLDYLARKASFARPIAKQTPSALYSPISGGLTLIANVHPGI